MKTDKSVSAEQLQVVSRFEGLRRILLSRPYAEHLQKPLAYWALPTDRRLPLAFLGRTLEDLLNRPFAELSATPGIGQKKIRSLIMLLSRAANTDPSKLPVDLATVPEDGKPVQAADVSPNGFDPATVSEVAWSQWRSTVIRHGLGGQTLGRLSPSLKNVSRVIWNTPLRAYVHGTLAEIRAMKTHGDKRVGAILEVFYGLHNLAADMVSQQHLAIRVVPRLIDAVETWTGRALQTPGVPSAREISEEFVDPLLEQIRIDAQEQIVRLAEDRLGIHGPITSVRQAARTMGLTRARVYQLLNEIADIMSVRWPLGRHQVHELGDKLHREAIQTDGPPELWQFDAAVELFYPGTRRGAAGPLERAFDPARPAQPQVGLLSGQA